MFQFPFLLHHINLTLRHHFCNNFNVHIGRSVPASDDNISIDASAGGQAAKLVLCLGAGTRQGGGGGGADRGLGLRDGQQWKGNKILLKYNQKNVRGLSM